MPNDLLDCERLASCRPGRPRLRFAVGHRWRAAAVGDQVGIGTNHSLYPVDPGEGHCTATVPSRHGAEAVPVCRGGGEGRQPRMREAPSTAIRSSVMR